MLQQYLAMAFGDTDRPVRKCHPVNKLYVIKQIRQTGNGFLSACGAISIMIWFNVHKVKPSVCGVLCGNTFQNLR